MVPPTRTTLVLPMLSLLCRKGSFPIRLAAVVEPMICSNNTESNRDRDVDSDNSMGDESRQVGEALMSLIKQCDNKIIGNCT